MLNNKIDVILISETHFTKKYYFKVLSYSKYHAHHSDGIIHSDTAIIIKNNI
jgi:hypothetical protein